MSARPEGAAGVDHDGTRRIRRRHPRRAEPEPAGGHRVVEAAPRLLPPLGDRRHDGVGQLREERFEPVERDVRRELDRIARLALLDPGGHERKEPSPQWLGVVTAGEDRDATKVAHDAPSNGNDARVDHVPSARSSRRHAEVASQGIGRDGPSPATTSSAIASRRTGSSSTPIVQ